MIQTKKGIGYGFIIAIITLIMGLLIFAIMMPLGIPYLESIKNSGSDPLTIFIFLAIPFWLLINLIVNAVVG